MPYKDEKKRKEYIKEYMKKYRKTNKNKLKQKEYQKKWIEKNKEYYKDYMKEYRKINPLLGKEYYIKNKEYYNNYCKKYHKENISREYFEIKKGVCPNCGNIGLKEIVKTTNRKTKKKHFGLYYIHIMKDKENVYCYLGTVTKKEFEDTLK